MRFSINIQSRDLELLPLHGDLLTLKSLGIKLKDYQGKLYVNTDGGHLLKQIWSFVCCINSLNIQVNTLHAG